MIRRMINRLKYLSPEIWLSEPRIVCGLMSGTSLDGVDAVIVRFSSANDKHKMKFLGFYYMPFDEKLKNKIIALISNTIHIRNVSEVNFSISHVYYEAVINLCQKLDFRINDIDLIGMHGQTVWHEPKPEVAGRTASSLQLGSPAVLAVKLKMPVVSDFRSADIALGVTLPPYL